MQKQATITSKGQITVPREIRRVLGVRSGDKLLFESDAKGIHVRPVRRQSAFSKYRGIGNPPTVNEEQAGPSSRKVESTAKSSRDSSAKQNVAPKTVRDNNASAAAQPIQPPPAVTTAP